jgi:hypothetical protein
MIYFSGIGGPNSSGGPHGVKGAGNANKAGQLPQQGLGINNGPEVDSFSPSWKAQSPPGSYRDAIKAISEKPVSYFENLPEGHPHKLNNGLLAKLKAADIG